MKQDENVGTQKQHNNIEKNFGTEENNSFQTVIFP